MKYLACLLMLMLSACGLRPLYSGGSTGAVAQALQGVEVSPIAGGKSGWLVRNALTDRLGGGAGAASNIGSRLSSTTRSKASACAATMP